MKIKLTLLVMMMFCLNIINYAGNPTISHSIASLNSPIIVGEDVYFNSTAISSGCCNCEAELLIDFGPFADQQFDNINFSLNNPMTSTYSSIIGPIVFNSPALFNVIQAINRTSGCFIDNQEFELPIEVLPAANIPTLSQWGLIIVGFFLMIFGVVSLKRRATAVES